VAPAAIWSELGIAPTRDAAAIRRAYATRLRTVRPDEDPQGFARLRQAYERALAMAAAAPATASVGAVPAQPLTQAVAPEIAPQIIPAVPRPDALAECLRRGDVLAAADWLLAARAAGTLPLRDDLRFTDRLGWAMAQDRTLPADAVRAAAERLGWLQGGAPDGWGKALRARLDAEAWLAALHRDAASWTRWVGGAGAVSARIMLGRGRLLTVPIMGRDRTLNRRYGEFLLHARIVGDQFDQARIAAVARLLTRRWSRWTRAVRRGVNVVVRAVTRAFAVFMIAGLCGEAADAVAPGLRTPVTWTILATGCAFLIARRPATRLLGRLRRR
jgi:hypothetical protein